MKKRFIYGAGVLAAILVLFVLPLRPGKALGQVASIALDWTATGDDANVGTATTYEMRYATTRPDTTSSASFTTWWNGATLVSGLPTPLISGTLQSVTIVPSGGFQAGRTYYFVIRAIDDAGNISGFSNVAWRAVPDMRPPSPIIDLRVR